MPGRSAAYGETAMVATSHPLATLAAIEVLREGGSAADAALAAAAVLCIAEPQMTGIGGDAFFIHANAAGAVQAYNGSGRAPAAAKADHFAARGITALEPTDAHAVTIPGAVDAWMALHAGHGRLPLDRLLGPAITLAREGCLVHPRVAWDWAHFEARAKARPEAAAVFLREGRALRAGERFVNPALAQTLSAIARQGRSAFYEGAVAESLARTLRAAGGLHTAEDFAAHTGEAVTPIRTRYRGIDVLECPPNGQGITALMLLNILTASGQDLADLSELDRIHLFSEATKLAYWERNTWCADPAFAAAPVEHLLSAAHAQALADAISMDTARIAPPHDRTAHTDTIYLCVVDRDLNCVSFINSLFNAFGSGIFDPATGVMLHNRGLGFTFAQGHPNRMDGGKRPLHTIIPGMALDADGHPFMPFGVMGGHYQAAGHAHFMMQVLDLARDPQAAAEAPRSFAHDGVLQVEDTFGADLRAGLAARGHEITLADQAIGGAQAIRIDRARGLLIGGSDPRKDGMALGW